MILGECLFISLPLFLLLLLLFGGQFIHLFCITNQYTPKMSSKSHSQNPLLHPILFLYQVLQWLLDAILSPRPPRSGTVLRRPKVAIIGAGITGVTSAAHCVGHGFDVVIFEGGDKSQLGGIWSVSSLTLQTFSDHEKQTC